MKRPGARKEPGPFFVLRALRGLALVEIAALGFSAETLDQIPVLRHRLPPAVFHKIGGEFLRARGRELSDRPFFPAFYF
jgi:hypothetical protein